jgi:hypothetical protein
LYPHFNVEFEETLTPLTCTGSLSETLHNFHAAFKHKTPITLKTLLNNLALYFNKKRRHFVKQSPPIMESGSTGVIFPKSEGSFIVEYKIKANINLKDIKEFAFDSTLILIDGE